MADYEYRAFELRRGASAKHAWEVLGIHAEYGEWELLRHAVYEGGVRKVTVRRRLRAESQPPLPS